MQRSELVALLIGVSILGIGTEQIVNKRALVADNSFMGILVKSVLLLLGVALVVLPIRAMLQPAEKQRAYRASLAQGARESRDLLVDHGAAARRAVRSTGAVAAGVGRSVVRTGQRVVQFAAPPRGR